MNVCMYTQIKMNGSGRWCMNGRLDAKPRIRCDARAIRCTYTHTRVINTRAHREREEREWRVENSERSLKQEHRVPLKTVTGSDSIYIMEKARDNVCTALFERGRLPIFPSPAATVQPKSLLMDSFGLDHHLILPSLDSTLCVSTRSSRSIPNFRQFLSFFFS